MPSFKQSDLPLAVMQVLGVTCGDSKALTNVFETWPTSDNASDFAISYLRREYLRKNDFLDYGTDKQAAALSSLRRDIEENQVTERRLNNLDGIKPAQVNRILRIQRKISRLIGDAPPSDIFERCRWSNGATYGIPRRNAFHSTKMAVPVEVTARASRYLSKEIFDDVHWTWSYRELGPIRPKDFVKIVPGNKLVFVPKTYKTFRSITPEPAGNIFLQLGVGDFLKRMLLRVGVDLTDQSRNQTLAALAIKLGLATLDLEAASNSMTTALIYLLFPPEWAVFLDDLRCQNTLLPSGEWVHDVLFSSMGNGFTFELESLIFWAVCSVEKEVASEAGPISVFGDDIIVPKTIADGVIESLAFFGFRVNKAKSFVSGPFYESCGAHYFMGEDVKPVYQKEAVSDLASLVRFHNRLYRWQLRTGHNLFDELLNKVRSRHPRLRQPESVESDDGFLCPSDEFRNAAFRCDVHGRYLCTLLTEKTKRRTSTSMELSYAYWHRRRGLSSHELNTSLRALKQSTQVSRRWVYWRV